MISPSIFSGSKMAWELGTPPAAEFSIPTVSVISLDWIRNLTTGFPVRRMQENARRIVGIQAWWLQVAAFALCHLGTARGAAPRAAFAVGIDHYQNVADLANGVSATLRFSEVLSKGGFEVSKLTNANKGNIQSGFSRFLETSRSAELRIFYFSGHGVETGGRNYLLPSNASAADEDELKGTCVSLGDLLAEMSRSRSGTDILILDCCRNNPFSNGNDGMASVSGLPDHTVILFAAQPGKVAYDRPLGGERVGESVSPFTLALIEAFSAEQDNLISLFSAVTTTVLSDTFQRQEPYLKLSASLASLQRFRIHVSQPQGGGSQGPWLFPHSRHTPLTHEELSVLSPDELWRARNEIYARHGFRFTSTKGLNYAATLGPAFYQPLKADVSDRELTKAELANIDLIKKFENAAKTGSPVPVESGAQPTVWLFPDSSSLHLSFAQLEELDSGALWVARNEIFARKGLIFQSARGKALCRKLGSAYQPVSSDQTVIFSRLNEFETANVDLIARFELGIESTAADSGTQISGGSSAGEIWLFPDSSDRPLTDAELASLSATQLKTARNEIYARRGFIFSTDFGRDIVRRLGAAYQPVSADMELIESRMNQVEKANIERIRRYEK